MVSIGNSQNISKEERIKIHIDAKGDTLTTMYYADSKILLEDVLQKKYSDSLVEVYKERDIIHISVNRLQKKTIANLINKNIKLEDIIVNLEGIMINRDRELEIANEVIDEQKKEIKRQKTKKVLGFIGAGVLTITAILISN